MKRDFTNLSDVLASIERALAAGCIELGVEGGCISWDIRLPEARQ